jgi:hypothetical protein
MGRGGYRPGAGRKKGQKDTKPRKGSAAAVEAEKIKAMLAMGVKAKARFYQEFLIRVSKGDKLSIAEKKLMDKLAGELATETKDNFPNGETEELDPLTYMLKVMNDPNEDKEMRARMATAAAPYVHARKGEGQGKKDDKADKAKAAGAGKFAPSKPPLKMVK